MEGVLPFRIHKGNNIHKHVFDRACGILAHLKEVDPDFVTTLVTLIRDVDKTGTVSYVLCVFFRQMKPHIIDANTFDVAILQSRNQVKILKPILLSGESITISPTEVNYSMFIIIETMSLVKDLETRIKYSEERIEALEKKFNDIWFHPNMPGGEEQIKKAKSHF